MLIEDLTLINSPAWTVNPVRCKNVNIRGLTIINPPDSPNTDGINPDSCRLVRISDCYISVGDDCITIKSGTQFEHPERRAACRDITITNCTLPTALLSTQMPFSLMFFAQRPTSSSW